MEIVIDANIVLSILIKPDVVLNVLTHNNLNVYSPSYLFEEVEEKLYIIMNKKKISEAKVDYLLNFLKKFIKIIPQDVYEYYMKDAKKFCPDIKDVPYFAVCLLLKCPLWSNDKALKNKQDRIEVYPTHELMKKL